MFFFDNRFSVFGLLLLCNAILTIASLLGTERVISSPDDIAKFQAIAQQRIAARPQASSDSSNVTPPSNSTVAAGIYSNSTTSLAQARVLIAAAIQNVTVSNKARVDNPRGNIYTTKPSTSSKFRRDTNTTVVTPEVASAAALLAEADAAERAKNGTLHRDYSEVFALWNKADSSGLSKRATNNGTWWLEGIEHLGTQPFGGNSSYKVFRNVKTDYGAKGDGVTDDTAAINRAISDGNRCGVNCESSSVKGAVVYFPAGTYLVSGTIISYYNTQLIGNPNNIPTIRASASFVGLGVISTDQYEGGTGEWYINQSNFYRQIRNFIIDISDTTAGYVAGLHYQVAQATSLYNIAFYSSTAAGTTQQGIFTENGSGGFMSDLLFVGGNFGIYGGNQQFTARGLTFYQCNTAIQLIWDWGWIWQGIQILSAKVGISLLGQDLTTRGTGSLLLQDCVFDSTTTAILTFTPIAGEKEGTTGITLDNVVFNSVTAAIQDNMGNVILPGSVGAIDTYTLGNTYFETSNGAYSPGTLFNTPRDTTLTSPTSTDGFLKLPYFNQDKNQYLSFTTSQVVQMKWFAKGDGVTDDTANFQLVLNSFSAPGWVIFIDAGSYILTDTITVPSGAQIVGECWAQLVASGAKFQSATSPHVLFRVGAAGGETGNAQIQDLLFTTKGPTQGLVAVEWNMAAATQGSAAMWDSHVRIGGALGTDLQVAQCPSVTSSVLPACIAGAMMLHVTTSSSAYLENVWLWTADHDLDDPQNTQVSVYVARGMLIESKQPVWLYGTASEHATLYQYEFYQSSNVLAAMIQTESPYYQPVPPPPAPFQATLGQFNGDPPVIDCSVKGTIGCDASWAVRIIESENITISGAGLYSWFQSYNEACVNTQNCQLSLVEVQNPNGNVFFRNLVTIGSVNMISDASETPANEIGAIINTNAEAYPWWSLITYYEPVSVPATNTVYVDPSIWTSGNPGFSCIPPCIIVLPPYPLGLTTTVTWPTLTTTLMSLSAGKTYTVTTTISVPPFTITAVDLQPITLKATDTATIEILPVQSIMPSSFIITLPASEATFPPTPIPTDWGVGQQAASTATPTTSSGLVAGIFPVVWSSTPYPVTIQPQPTMSITLPPLKTPIPAVTYSSAKPTSTCKSGCGTHDCGIFGCWPYCGLFGCDGGCSIFGCGGGCGPLGCIGDCFLDICGGLGCIDGGCGYAGGEGNPENEDCDEPKTASACTMFVSSWSTAPMTAYSTTTKTHCETIVDCTASDTETTTTQTTDYPQTGSLTISLFETVDTTTPNYAALETSILSVRMGWDSTRFGSMIKPTTTTAAPSPTATTLAFCYYEELTCSGGSTCNGFEEAAYFWFFNDGHSTCETIWSASSYIGANVDKTGLNTTEESSTYHFPTGSVELGQVPGGSTNCAFNPDGGEGSAAAADSYYGPIAQSGGVGEADCNFGTSETRLGYCYKEYIDYSIEEGAVKTILTQLFNCNWQSPAL